MHPFHIVLIGLGAYIYGNLCMWVLAKMRGIQISIEPLVISNLLGYLLPPVLLIEKILTTSANLIEWFSVSFWNWLKKNW